MEIVFCMSLLIFCSLYPTSTHKKKILIHFKSKPRSPFKKVLTAGENGRWQVKENEDSILYEFVYFLLVKSEIYS